MGRRTVLTELGPDDQALRDEDKAGILFDLGLDCLQIDACVRVRDPDLIAQLRNGIARPLFEAGNPAIAAILAANPHRVFVSRLGRIEVFQAIPPADGKSPQGPHTHVLPKLLAHKRTHAATEPVPDDCVPCAHCYPPNPVRDGQGRSRPFDAKSHVAFQAILEQYGDLERLALKRRLTDIVATGQEPFALTTDGDRFGRATVRVTLRQLRASGVRSATLAAWLAVFDRPEEASGDGAWELAACSAQISNDLC
jgi:hypothetical protein